MNASVPREKLAAVLGMLGSDHDGERAAAALIASRIVREAGLSWRELLVETSSRDEVGSTEQQPATPTRAEPHWREMLAAARRRPELLTEWESRFLSSIAWQRSLSPKQRAILAEIADKASAMTG
jgi:hypothetical protein